MNYRIIALIVFYSLLSACALETEETNSLRAITMLTPDEKSVITQPEIAFS